MQAFHTSVEGASPSESRRATRIATGIALASAMLIGGVVDVAQAKPPEVNQRPELSSSTSVSSVTEPSFNHRRIATEPIGAPSPANTARLADERSAVNTIQDTATLLDTHSSPAKDSAPVNPVLPDSEVIHSPSAKDFDTPTFVTAQGGFLGVYQEQVAGVWMSGGEIVERVSQNHSIHPRLLLAIVEYKSGWVLDPRRPTGEAFHFPIRTGDQTIQGLYLQLTWTANALSYGYYGWRQDASDQDALKEDPNAGTAALNELLIRMCSDPECIHDLMGTYRQLFGDPWEYSVEIHSEDLDQPALTLPFPRTNEWILTGGPHPAWGSGYPWAALDFAPKWDTNQRSSNKDVVAVADGVVARVDHGIVVLDLDGDGYEQTGWAIFYLHVVATEWIKEGSTVRQGQIIGQASSVGGIAQSDHLHIARKFNGEWIPAVGSVPFELGGWRVRLGVGEYDGQLFKDSGNCSFLVSVGDALQSTPFQECRIEGLS